MATATQSLAPLTSTALDPDASAEYQSRLDAVMKSLENRNQTNWFSIAGALMDPGRSGNFGEAIGRAAGNYGAQLEKQQEAEPNLAMMRANIAQQKYALAQQAEGFKILGGVLGMTPEEAARRMATGDMSPDLMSKVLNNGAAMTALGIKAPAMLHALTSASEAQTKMAEQAAKTRGLDQEDVKILQNINKEAWERGTDYVLKTYKPDLLKRLGFLPENYADRGAASTVLTPPPASPAAPAAPVTKPANPENELGSGLFKLEAPEKPPQTAPGPTGVVFPVAGGVPSSNFGQRTLNGVKEDHPGWDIAAKRGTPVQVIRDGTVIGAVANETGYGNQVLVRHPDGAVSMYAHLDRFTVKPGQTLNAGDVLGTVGSTGKSTGDHLHLEYMDDKGVRLDPAHLFRQPPPAQVAQAPQQTRSDAVNDGLTPAQRQEQAAKNAASAEGPMQERTTTVLKMPKELISRSNSRMDEIHGLADKHGPILNMMMQQGILPMIYRLAKEGVSADAGHNKYSISVDFGPAARAFKGNTEQQEAVRRLTQLIGDEFLYRATALKHLLGANPSDRDASLFQIPMANVDDTARLIKNWAAHAHLDNLQALETRRGLVNYIRAHGTGAGTFNFWEGEPMKRIDDMYAAPRNNIIQNFLRGK